MCASTRVFVPRLGGVKRVNTIADTSVAVFIFNQTLPPFGLLESLVGVEALGLDPEVTHRGILSEALVEFGCDGWFGSSV